MSLENAGAQWTTFKKLRAKKIVSSHVKKPRVAAGSLTTTQPQPVPFTRLVTECTTVMGVWLERLDVLPLPLQQPELQPQLNKQQLLVRFIGILWTPYTFFSLNLKIESSWDDLLKNVETEKIWTTLKPKKHLKSIKFVKIQFFVLTLTYKSGHFKSGQNNSPLPPLAFVNKNNSPQVDSFF